MADVVTMPKQGITVESCILGSYEKKVGDPVKVGDVLFSYETDKASFEEVARVSGTLLAVFFEEGEEVPVLENVCVIGSVGEDVSQFAPNKTPKQQNEASLTQPTDVPTLTLSRQTTAGGGVSPRAKRLAKTLGVDPTQCVATGAEGRVVEADIRRVFANGSDLPNGSTAAPSEVAACPVGARDERLSSIRQAIAKAMTTSLATIPQLTHTMRINADELLKFRKEQKAAGNHLVTLNAMVLFAVSRVLKNHPALNAHMLGDGKTLRYFDAVHLGMATDTPRGLMVPNLKNADTLSLTELAATAKALQKEASGGSISPDNLRGGTFTVTNLGALNVESFTPVINPPETGILGVGTISPTLKLAKDGTVHAVQEMVISLTYDHRAVDGAPASRFMVDVKEFLEHIAEHASE